MESVAKNKKMIDIIKDSINWKNQNVKYISHNRWEGELTYLDYNQNIFNEILTYEDIYANLKNSYFVGFELEFYIRIDSHELLLRDLIKCIPREKMVIESIYNNIPSDGNNFFLIEDLTGTPPDGFISLELISPKFDSKFVPYHLSSIFDILNKYCLDDDSLGLHFHISTPEAKKISPISLLYSLYKNDLFTWNERKFTRDIINQFFYYHRKEWKYIYEYIIRKNYNVNFLHFHQDNRIEYRAIGGKNYLKEKKRIIESFLKILLSYEFVFSTSHKEMAELI